MENVTALRPHNFEPFVTKPELARHLQLSERWVELRQTEGMPCHRFGARVRYRVSEVESWLAARAAA